MECRKCGTPTVEGAAYCSNCGARLDGKKPCKACGKLNDESFAYCVYCGTRIDGKKVCSSCGNAYEGNFCRVRGQADLNKSQNGNASLRTEGKSVFGTVRKIFDIVGGGAGMLAVAFALIFVFFIGVVDRNGTNGDEAMGIFYYFGDFFKEVKELDLSGESTTSVLLGVSTYTYGILGLILSVATLSCVVAFAITAVTVYVRNWLGLTEKRADKWVLMTVFAFVVGAAWLYAMNSAGMSGKISVAGTEYAQEIVWNGATVAGITLCSIFLAITYVCRLAEKGKALIKAENLLKYAFAAAGVVLTSVLFVLAKNANFAVELTYGSVSLDVNAAFLGFNIGFLQGFSSEVGTAEISTEIIEMVERMSVYNVVAQVLALTVIVFAALGLCANLKNFAEEKRSTGLAWAILAFVLAVGLMVFSLLSGGELVNMLEYVAETEGSSSVKASASYGTVIAAVVLAALSLGMAIVHCVFAHQAKVKRRLAEQAENV